MRWEALCVLGLVFAGGQACSSTLEGDPVHEAMAPLGDEPSAFPSGAAIEEPALPGRPPGVSRVAATRYLSDRAWSSTSNGWGSVERDRANGEAGDADGAPMSIRGVAFAKGLGVHAPSDVRYSLGQRCASFTVDEGVDDEASANAQVTFQVWADGVLLDDSGQLRRDSPVRHVSVNLDGRRELKLVVTDGGNGANADHADWAGARLVCDQESASPPPLSNLAWRMLGLVIRNTDVAFTDPATGQSRRVTTHLTEAEESGVIEAVRQTPKNIVDWSNGRAGASLDVVTVDDAVRSVSPITGGFWVSPSDVKPLLDVHAPPGRYDSIFVMWDPDGPSGKVPACCFWGRGRGSDTNGATFAALPVFSEGTWGGPHPGEAFIHEWLHGATAYYRTERGLLVPDPHDNALYGFLSADAQGSWSAWYKAHLAGELTNTTTNVRAGFGETAWASGRPTMPVGPIVAPPSHVRASGDEGRVALSWTANSLADHYRVFRGTSPGDVTYLGWTRDVSFTDASATAGTLYHYVVRSVSKTQVESASSNEVSLRP